MAICFHVWLYRVLRAFSWYGIGGSKSTIFHDSLVTWAWLRDGALGTILFTVVASAFGFLNGLGTVRRLRILAITNFRFIAMSYGSLLFRRERWVTGSNVPPDKVSLFYNWRHKYEKQQIRSFEFDTMACITVLKGPHQFAAIRVISTNGQMYRSPFLRRVNSLVPFFPNNLNKNFENYGIFKTYLQLIFQKLSQENIGLTGNDFRDNAL